MSDITYLNNYGSVFISWLLYKYEGDSEEESMDFSNDNESIIDSSAWSLAAHQLLDQSGSELKHD